MNIYNEELVEDEESRALKELGFEYEPLYSKFTHNIYKHDEYWDIGPTYSQAFRWFEDNHSMFIERVLVTTPNEIIDITYKIKSFKFVPNLVEFENDYDEFDRSKAELACLKKLIELIK